MLASLYQPYAVGGAERVVQDLAEGMSGLGHQVEVLSTAPDGIERRETIGNVPVDFVRVRNAYRPFDKGETPSAGRRLIFHAMDSWNPYMASLVSRKVKAFRPDVVNSHNITGFSPTAFRAIHGEGVPIVHTLHDQYLLCPKTTMYRADNCQRRCLICKPYAMVRGWQAEVDLVVGVSEFILERHRRLGLFGNSPSRVIRNAAPENCAGSRPRGVLPVRFGYLGQIRPTKGLHILVRAFLAEQFDNAELYIAGRGDPAYETELKAATAGHPNVQWLGFADNRIFLDSIDVLVVPSVWHDTAPLVLLEAFSASRPVIASNRGGIPEFVTPDTGWIFDSSRPEQLRALLRSCVDDPGLLTSLGGRAKLVAERQNSAKFLSEYQDAYSSVCN